MVCLKCGQVVDDQDSYCRYCGFNLKSNSDLPWFYQSWAVYLGIILFGPLILPLVFKNPAYSQNKKIILTIIIIVYTLILLVLPTLALNYIYQKVLVSSGCY
jgi:branched-subunit amino acid transport protein